MPRRKRTGELINCSASLASKLWERLSRSGLVVREAQRLRKEFQLLPMNGKADSVIGGHMSGGKSVAGLADQFGALVVVATPLVRIRSPHDISREH